MVKGEIGTLSWVMGRFAPVQFAAPILGDCVGATDPLIPSQSPSTVLGGTYDDPGKTW